MRARCLRLRSRFFAFAFVYAFATLGAGDAVAAPVWSDPLTGAQIDTTHWTVGGMPIVTFTPSSMGVLMSIDGTPHGRNFGGGLVSTCLLVGDFDVQVDYQLASWPDHSGMRTALGMNDTPTTNNCAVERVSLSSTADVSVMMPGSEVYIASIVPSQPFPDVPTTDTQGTMRLTRSGTTETAYFAAAGGTWTIIYSATNSDVPVYGGLSIFSSDEYRTTPGAGSSIYFRNYVVNAGDLRCPDAGTADAGTADAGTADAPASDAVTRDASPAEVAPSDTATVDAIADAAEDVAEAGVDGGKKPGANSSGCGCAFGSGRTPTAAGVALLALAVLAARRRRRAR